MPCAKGKPLSSFLEKFSEKPGALLLQDTVCYAGFGVQGCGGKAAVPPFLVAGTKNEPSHLGPAYGTGAHHAGFERDIERAFGHILPAHDIGGSRDGLHLGMCRDVAECLGEVMSPGYDAVFVYNNRPYGYLTPVAGGLGFGQGLLHIVPVALRDRRLLILHGRQSFR